MNKPDKIFIIGGHLAPAVAVLQELQRRHIPQEVVFVGRKYAMEEDVEESEEYRIIKARNIRFLPLTTGRLRRFLSLGTILSLGKVPIGFVQAFHYVLKEKPSLIVSFGGYLALPIVVGGWILGVPAITHEQTRKPGLANKIISLLALKVCVTFDDIAYPFPKEKTVVTGLPIRKEIFEPPKSSSFIMKKSHHILYVSGGTTGSERINKLFYPIIPQIISEYVVVHQVGRRSIKKAEHIRMSLDTTLRDRYIPMPYLESEDHAWVLRQASIVLSRSGANTVGEIALVKAPAILVPLGGSKGEQYENAKWLGGTTPIEILDENMATPEVLLGRIKSLGEKIKLPNSLYSYPSFRTDGTSRLVDEVLRSLG